MEPTEGAPLSASQNERILEWVLLDRWLTPFRPAMQIVTEGLELRAWQWRELDGWDE